MTPRSVYAITTGRGSLPKCTEQDGTSRLGPNTIIADLVGPVPNERRHCRPHFVDRTPRRAHIFLSLVVSHMA